MTNPVPHGAAQPGPWWKPLGVSLFSIIASLVLWFAVRSSGDHPASSVDKAALWGVVVGSLLGGLSLWLLRGRISNNSPPHRYNMVTLVVAVTGAVTLLRATVPYVAVSVAIACGAMGVVVATSYSIYLFILARRSGIRTS